MLARARPRVSSAPSSRLDTGVAARFHDVAPKAWFDDLRSMSVAQIEDLAVHWTRLDGKPSPNFEWQEYACNGDGLVVIDPELVTTLEKLRSATGGKPLLLNSAYRSPAYNARVGGAATSRHMRGAAVDISMANHDPHRFIEAALDLGVSGVGTYPASNFVHIDVGYPGYGGKVRRWGDPFPAREGRFDGGDGARATEIDRGSAKDAVVVGGGAVVAGPVIEEAVDDLMSPGEMADAAINWGDRVAAMGDWALYAIGMIGAVMAWRYWRVIQHRVNGVFQWAFSRR